MNENIPSRDTNLRQPSAPRHLPDGDSPFPPLGGGFFLLAVLLIVGSAAFLIASLQVPAVVMACAGALLMGYLMEGVHK